VKGGTRETGREGGREGGKGRTMNSRPVYQPPIFLTMRGAGRRATWRRKEGREGRKKEWLAHMRARME